MKAQTKIKIKTKKTEMKFDNTQVCILTLTRIQKLLLYNY